MIDADRQHQAAEQARRDIVDVRRTARDDLALHGELEELQARRRRLDQGVGGDHGGDRGRGRAAHAGRQRNALLDVDLEAETEPKRRMHGLHRTPGGVAAGIDREFAGDPGDGANAHHGLLDAPSRTRSPTASTVWPRISKPMPTLATVAGAKAVTSVHGILGLTKCAPR